KYLTTPKYVKVKDEATGIEIVLPGACSQKDFNSARKYKAKDSDVFVCSYPKTGTTWLLTITWLIVHHGEEIPKNYTDSIPTLEFDGCENIEAIDDGEFPRIIKTHFPYKLVPKNLKAKYLYITRNPKDAFVSYYFHVRGFNSVYHWKNPDLSNLYELYIKGEVTSGLFFDHLKNWYAHRNDPNVLFLLYEDVKQDPRNEVLKIAKFLGDEYEKKLKMDDGKILEIILERSSFSHMKGMSAWHTTYRPENEPFIRKGVIGDWKNHLSTEQADGLDRALMEHGKESGISKLWDK
uniref:Sulfotransferase n=2 Tax=Ciona intestinalis TaxID=7719 RepID=F6X329_CIOIN